MSGRRNRRSRRRKEEGSLGDGGAGREKEMREKCLVGERESLIERRE